MASILDSKSGGGVPVFQLLQWKHAIRLEALGMRHSRGSVTAHAKRALNIRGNRDKVQAEIQRRLDAYKGDQS